jgi:hypothetical protein
MSVEDDFFFQEVIESAIITPPDLNAMEWFHPYNGHRLAHPNSLTWHITQM